ncbi:hypothetical protein ES703_46250 [subsurface metagenome]
MYDLNLTRDEVIDIGKNILKTEIEFNEKAGISHSTNDVPEFFRQEPSEPTGLKYTFSKEDLKSFWDKLRE